MLKRFIAWASCVAGFGLFSVGPVAAAEALIDSPSTKPSVSQPVKSSPGEAQHSKRLGTERSVDAAARRPLAVRSTGGGAAASSKSTNLAKAQPIPKLVSAENRSKPAVKVAVQSVVGNRPTEVGSKSAFRAEDVVALPSAPTHERSKPTTLVSDSSLMPPGDAYTQARSLEGENQTVNAIPLYAEASRQGHSAASLRLMEIYAMGAEGVSRNYIAAVEFKRLAVQQGARLEYPPHR